MGRGKKIVDVDVVVEEAIALIEEGGVEEFSTRRLAARLGISAMTLYNYYENRGAILAEALERGLKMLWEGLPAEVAAWRESGGSRLGAYRKLSEHLLAFAQSQPRLCRFVLTESAAGDWGTREGLVDRICGAWEEEGSDTERSATIHRDIYLFELLVFALALKVIGGGESPERFSELSEEGYARLIGRHELAGVAAG